MESEIHEAEAKCLEQTKKEFPLILQAIRQLQGNFQILFELIFDNQKKLESKNEQTIVSTSISLRSFRLITCSVDCISKGYYEIGMNLNR